MMRTSVVAWILVGLIGLSVGAAPLHPDELLGTWGNVDTLASGLAEVKIATSPGGGLDIYGFGVCTPSFCEWGPTPLVLASMPPGYVNEWGVAIWDLDPWMAVMFLRREGPFLVAEIIGYFTDGTGLPMREIVLLRQIE
ncbi:MAG: hypothetical protein AB1778_01090 [Candidatus Bipolaricaulota bacterium]